MTGSESASTATAELLLGGMHCGSCVALIEETLASHDGVRQATVTLEPPRAEVVFDPADVAVAELCGAVASLGYSASALGESSPSA